MFVWEDTVVGSTAEAMYFHPIFLAILKSYNRTTIKSLVSPVQPVVFPVQTDTCYCTYLYVKFGVLAWMSHFSPHYNTQEIKGYTKFTKQGAFPQASQEDLGHMSDSA